MPRCKLNHDRKSCRYGESQREADAYFDCDVCDFADIPELPLSGKKAIMITGRERRQMLEIFSACPHLSLEREDEVALFNMLRTACSLENLHDMLGAYLLRKM